MTGTFALAVIIGSVRKDRVGPAVSRWFVEQVRAHTAADIDVIDLDELALPPDLAGGGDAGTFRKRIDRADAVVVVTPEYNRGYPGTLKTAIDTVLPEWRAKPEPPPPSCCDSSSGGPRRCGPPARRCPTTAETRSGC